MPGKSVGLLKEHKNAIDTLTELGLTNLEARIYILSSCYGKNLC